ncbi:hypothetical protein EVG20_g8956 [Dentipellis fragilis]|uniref:Carboxylic ester hydrolase n=1 Tax=Dentipellis fragilis TaxID=205917 RepID=A0A4Y9Y345_9AGAM|nr:hypothetical protein EVG20_g8956 [Dentipellis fragilis]
MPTGVRWRWLAEETSLRDVARSSRAGVPREFKPRQTPKDLDVDLSLQGSLSTCAPVLTSNYVPPRSRTTPLSVIPIDVKSRPPFYIFTAAYTIDMPAYPLTRNIAHSSHSPARTPDRVAAVRCSITTSLLLLVSGFRARGSPPNVVDVGYATYRGNQSFPNTVAYLGIPYAEPPLGDRRWRVVLPLDTGRIQGSTRGQVVDATQYPDFCVQGSTGAGDAGGAGSEDCLKVNIYAPSGAKKGSNFPVLVYFHGGGFVDDNPRNWPFDHWIHQSPNVVILTVYYRLDAFGFLSVDQFSDSAHGNLNVGFQDQVQALKWVKQYISAFGGNPEEVTINGQSAGGTSVELHLTARQEESLFSRAIAQSVYRTPVPTVEQQTVSGCGSGSVTDQLSCLRLAPVSALARAQDNASYGSFDGPYNAFRPVQDGKLITGHPSTALMNGQFTHVPLIVGSTSNETLSEGTDINSALQAFFPSLSNSSLSQYLEVYPASDFDNDDQRFQVATGESELICGRAVMAAAAAQFNQTFTYRYNQPNPTCSNPTVVSHSAENWMMFRGSNLGFNGSATLSPMTPTEDAFAKELIAYWLSFVRSRATVKSRRDWKPTLHTQNHRSQCDRKSVIMVQYCQMILRYREVAIGKYMVESSS